MWKVKYFLLTIIAIFINSYAFSDTGYGSPAAVDFGIDLQAGSATFDMVNAKLIANSLFGMACILGVINVIRTSAFHPDKLKKVIINWCVGIIVFAVVINILG
jgi:hypothetical protein